MNLEIDRLLNLLDETNIPEKVKYLTQCIREENNKELVLLKINQEWLDEIIKEYKTGSKIDAVKLLISEANKPYFAFGIKDAKEFLDKATGEK